MIQKLATIGFLGSGTGLTDSCFSGGYFLASMIGLARGSKRSGRFGVLMTSPFRKWTEQIRVLKPEIEFRAFLLSQTNCQKRFDSQKGQREHR